MTGKVSRVWFNQLGNCKGFFSMSSCPFDWFVFFLYEKEEEWHVSIWAFGNNVFFSWDSNFYKLLTIDRVVRNNSELDTPKIKVLPLPYCVSWLLSSHWNVWQSSAKETQWGRRLSGFYFELPSWNVPLSCVGDAYSTKKIPIPQDAGLRQTPPWLVIKNKTEINSLVSP